MSFVVSDPLKQFFIFHAAVCDSKPDMYQFRIGAFNADKVTLFLLLKTLKIFKNPPDKH